MKAMDKCKEIMREIALRGYTNQIHKRELEKIIMEKCGIDKRTIQNWLNALSTLGFIEAINPCVYLLHFDKSPELLSLLIQNGQKKLM